MPRRRSTFIDNNTSEAASAPDPILAQTQESQMGSLRKLLGTGIRVAAGVGSGVASAVPGIGSLVGAGLSAGGESLAEFAEGSKQNPYRIAAEGALGAVPFGRWIGAARGAKGALAAGRDFLAGGAAAGLGEGSRQWAEGEDMDAATIAATTAGGGALGAGIGSLARMLGGPTAVPKPPSVKPIQTVNVKTQGGNVAVERATPKTEGVNRFSDRSSYDEFRRAQGFSPGSTSLVKDPTETMSVFQMSQPWTKTSKPHRKVLGLESKDIGKADGDAMGKHDEAIRKGFDKKESWPAVEALKNKSFKDVTNSLDEGIASSEKQAASGRSKRLAYEADINKFDEAQTSKFGRSTPQIPARQGAGMWSADELDETMDWVPEAALPSKVGQWDLDELDEVMPAPPQQGVGMWSFDELDETMPAIEPPSALAALYKNRPQAMESAYGGMKDALHSGEMSEEVAKTSQKILGKGLGNERAAWSAQNPTSGDWVTQELAKIAQRPSQAQLRQQTHPSFYDEGFDDLAEVAPKVPNQNVHPSFYDDGFDNLPNAKAPKKGKGNAAGFVEPELAGAMAGGSVGGLYGLTQDEGPYPGKGWKNRARNAALYGGAGALAGVGAAKVAGAEEWSTPAFQQGAKELLQQLPNIQRFNYLASPTGLIANAGVGPYGSALSAGLETAVGSTIGRLGGKAADPRGDALLNELNPLNYLKEFVGARGRAKRLIEEGELGRAEMSSMGDTPFHKMLEQPGQLMTQGDEAARTLAMRAGYSDPESRAITMTNEPENAFLRRNVDAPKGDILGQMLFPFRRTPMNAAEQGARRLPGIGIGVQLARGDKMDPWNEVIAQQILGTGYMGAGYLAGERMDPDTAKWARRFVTNAAGRNSLGAGMGFAMGQANSKGQNRAKALLNPMMEDNYMPLPGLDPIMDSGRMVINALDGDAKTEARLPRGAAPGAFHDLLFPRTETVSRRVSRKF